MRDKDYRLPAHPKSTIREKQGSHRDLSVCKLDFTRTERAIFARTMERKNRRIKEAIDAWEYRSCDKEKCSAVIESKRNRPITCKKIMQCSWAIYKEVY